MKEYKMHIEKENELHFEDIISKEDFKVSASQWRYKKKIEKLLERLLNKSVENNAERYSVKNVKFRIKKSENLNG
jgi:hypothetical protein